MSAGLNAPNFSSRMSARSAIASGAEIQELWAYYLTDDDFYAELSRELA